MFKGIANTTLGTYASVLFWAIILAGAIVWFIGLLYPTPLPDPDANPVVTDCELVGTFSYLEDITLSENAAGTYRYELYATPDDVLIYKCDN